MSEDYYQVLGVPRTATKDDIKRAYRRLAHQHHPDKEGGNEDTFKQVNAAYQVLSDDTKRAQYDQFGTAFEGSGGTPPGWEGINMNDLGGMGDIFEQFFGGAARGRGRQVRRGHDIGVDVSISFVESAHGVTREVSTRLYAPCTHCEGSGAEPGTPIKECTTCRGSGTVTSARQTMLGTFNQTSACPTCQGEGKQAETPCRECRGEGRTLQTRTLDVAIPAGIGDGQTIRLSGHGEAPPRGGIAGDLYVTVHVASHKNLVRQGDDIHSKAKLSYTDAILGTTLTVETLRGSTELTIPAGTQPGAIFTLRGEGFPSLQGGRHGNHVVTAEVQIPRKITKNQRQLLEELRAGSKKKRRFF